MWISETKYAGLDIWIIGKEKTILRSGFGSGVILDQLAKRQVETGIQKIESLNCKRLLRPSRQTRNDDLSLSPTGTPFQKKVWKALLKIPFGKIVSYKQLAVNIGKPKAFRAVANACGANPIPLFIPCHRVIKSDGTLGGFSSGIKIKKKLLKLELSTSSF